MLGTNVLDWLRTAELEPGRCPMCGALVLRDGRCENRACTCHWHPISPDEILPGEEEEEN